MPRSDLYTIGEVAAILGVSAHTVRAWEHRYGTLQPARTASGHRRYRPDEINLLQDVRRAVALQGMSLRLAFETFSQPHDAAERRLTVRAETHEDGAQGLEATMWQAVADLLPDIVLVTDSNGDILRANVTAARKFGTVRQQLVRRNFIHLVERTDRDKAESLIHPRPHGAAACELNLLTSAGARLYFVRSRVLTRTGEMTVALMANEMFPTDVSSPPLVPTVEEAPTTLSVFRTLLDQLPFGLAITTIGQDPRVAYANQRLTSLLAGSARTLSGRKLSDLLPAPITQGAFRTASTTGHVQSVKGVLEVSAAGGRRRELVFDFSFQPLFSSSRKVAGMLAVIENMTSAGHAA